jgi:hypothetical protein
LADQCGLRSIECSPVRRHLQQSQIDRQLIDHCPIAASRGGNEALLGIEDPL